MVAENCKTLCIILHYGEEHHTWNCVDSISAELEICDIIIVDNDPRQNLKLPSKTYDFVKIIRTGGRAGFSEANNIGVKNFIKNHHHSILILNNDTLIEKNAIHFMRDTLDQQGVGIVGPCMPYADYPTKIWSCGGWVNKKKGKIGGLKCVKGDEFYDVDYLPGAAILCRPDVWKLVRGLPEKYFLAYEEAEFALEVNRCGWRVVVEPRAIVYHKVGMSSHKHPMYFYNRIRNRIIFSQYLDGRYIGIILGIYRTSDSLRFFKLRRFQLWIWAIRDAVLAVPLSRNQLDNVASATRTWKEW